jgi:hypothetical protein
MVPKTRLASKADNDNTLATLLPSTSTPARAPALSETDMQTQLRPDHSGSPLNDVPSSLSSPSSDISMTSPPISSPSSDAGSSSSSYDSDADDTLNRTPHFVASSSTSWASRTYRETFCGTS